MEHRKSKVQENEPQKNEPMKIRRVAVLGSGVMGSQIATLLAAAGTRVYLFDLTAKQSEESLKMIEKLKPSPYYSITDGHSVVPCSFEQDFSVLADCDWIIEAVVERLDIKKSIHKKILEFKKPHVPVTTNTSGISLIKIAEDLPEHYQETFFGTHFFNPPRYMKLLEIIPHQNTDEVLMEKLCLWIEERLGKGIVYAQDTVNFIANRIGVFGVQAALKYMTDLNLNFETVDLLTGPISGKPSSASFRTVDVVGLDTYMHVIRNTYECAIDDPYKEFFKITPHLQQMVDNKLFGQKAKAGFYKKVTGSDGNSQILVLKPNSLEYVPQAPQKPTWFDSIAKIPDLVTRIQKIFEQNDPAAQLIQKSWLAVVSYSSLLVDSIAAGRPRSVDEAVMWGFNWEMGPFEMWQRLGYGFVRDQLIKNDFKVPTWAQKDEVNFYMPAPTSDEWAKTGPRNQIIVPSKSREEIRAKNSVYLPSSGEEKDSRTIFATPEASLIDLSDGVACLVFHSKMNALSFDMTQSIQKAIAVVDDKFKALVIANNGSNFSAGANLKQVHDLFAKKDWESVEKFQRSFQACMQLIKFASFPVIACPHHLTLGGGCEVALHAKEIYAFGETYSGLVEIGVGILPAAGGTKELALRAYQYAAMGDKVDPMPFLQRAFMLIAMAKTSSSAQEAVEMGLYPQNSKVFLNQERIAGLAKNRALQILDEGFVPRTPARDIAVVGDPGFQTFRMMLYNMLEQKMVSEHDALIAEKIALILCSGDIDAGERVTEQHFLALECKTFIDLCKTEKTQARVAHMLQTGKPLRN